MGSRLSSGEVMRGIFIKHILEDSPAGKNGTLKTGDRIVEVPTMCLSVVVPPASQESLKWVFAPGLNTAVDPAGFGLSRKVHCCVTNTAAPSTDIYVPTV